MMRKQGLSAGKRNILGFVTIIFLVFIQIQLLIHSSESSTPKIDLPDTNAGRCASAYFKAFNSGSNEHMRDFIRQYRNADFHIERDIQSYRKLHELWKKLTPVRIAMSLENEITLLVLPANKGEGLIFRLHLQKVPPYKILYFTRSGVRLSVDQAAEVSNEDIVGTADRARPIDEKICTQTVISFSDAIARHYIYPQKGKEIKGRLLENKEKDRYSNMKKAGKLADMLSKDTYDLSKDGHLWIEASNPQIHSIYKYNRPLSELRCINFDFEKVEILKGNVGYIKFNFFHERDEALDIAAKALAAVADCDVLIFDIRDNMGGGGKMLRMMLSYLFEKPTTLSIMYNRDGQIISRLETLDKIPGKRFSAHVPVYILTSKQTGSAAESFAYNLKHFGRAVIVGEKTIGMAHPSKEVKINDFFRASIPYLRSENLRTHKDWEGVGVIPDIQTSSENALKAAIKHASSYSTRS